MKFYWVTKDCKSHSKVIDDYEERLKFIGWLETSDEVLWWR